MTPAEIALFACWAWIIFVTWIAVVRGREIARLRAILEQEARDGQ